ncbi:type IV pilin protein [Pseudomonas sp. R5(2019)]|uniref:type IV pilin protein n=1 Tax=Pseudomonas sp. R5(2019) TaxID=2697566 RepID=UPI001412FAF4|nr:type IV pilin protein [Pseudomonas sp. R5(2019)]NBA96433.1 prepilin-type N-terminal cleavage/methylation domain-containing protein [Pseudomonas sp. R5(2019)]
MRRTNKGFTLIELLIVVAVIGILASIAYPSYTEYIKKARRTEVAGLLSETAQNLERHYSRTGQYSDTSTIITAVSAGTDYYTLVATRNAQDFTLTATRKTGTLMAGDKCGDFVLTQTGARTNPNSARGVTSKTCWGR